MLISPSKLLRFGVFCLSLLLVFPSCNKKQHSKPPAIDPGFAVYITGFSSGLLSVESTIKIQLAQDYAGANPDSGFLKEKLFKFSPGIQGKVVWADNRTLEFRPEKPLPPGEIFTAEFQLYKLMDVPEKFRTFRFQFQTISQHFSVTTEGLSVMEGSGRSLYSLKGSLLTADVIDGLSIENVLNAKTGSSGCFISWIHDPDRKTHHFQIDSIVRTNQPAELLLTWKGDKIAVDHNGEEKIEIPSLQDFKVLGCRIVNEENPYIIVNFSDPLEVNQELRGLIRLGSSDDLTIDINNNLLKVYTRFKAVDNQLIVIDKGIRNIDGKTLVKPYSTEIQFYSAKPAIRLLGKGVILPASAGLILPFEAINLSKVDIRIVKIFEDNVAQFLQINNLEGNEEVKRVGRPVYREQMNLLTSRVNDPGKWSTYFLDLAPLIDHDPGAVYNVTFSFKKEYSLYKCPGEPNSANSMQKISSANEMSEDDRYWDDAAWYYYDYYPEGYRWEERENPCSISYYTQEKFVSRNILASDLGIIAKNAAKNKLFVAVTDLISTEPMNNVDIEIFTYQKQLISKGNTGRDGMITLDVGQKPFLLVAKKGKQRGYLRLDDGSSLSLSKFDVAGATVQQGLKGFIFGERGVWRPGDTLFLTFMLEDKDHTLPEGHPVTLEVMDPKGQVVNRMINTKGLNGFYRFTFSTDPDAPTGNWTAYVKVGGAVFSRNLKIETVKPNRLKINLDFGEKLLSTAKGLHGNLNIAWLTGATANRLRATITTTFTQLTTSFTGYKEFIFDDPTKRFYGEEQLLFEGKTDEQGNASFTHVLAVNGSAPGMLQAGFTVRAFEEGGDISTDYFTLPVSAYSTYVGIRLPKGDKTTGMLLTGKDIKVEVATLDKEGKEVSSDDLEATVYKINWRWWWNASDNDLASYEGDIERTPVYRTNFSTSGGKASFVFRVNYPDWGRYLVKVKDNNSGHSTGTSVYIDWPSWQSRDRQQDPEAATMLSFSANKEKFNVGEDAVLTIPTSGKGRALISLESGSKVIDAYWVNVNAGETVVSIKMKKEMAPNVYAHITLVQPHAQTVNDLPLRMYGVIPLLVTDPATQLHPVITAAAVIKPEKVTTVSVSERNGKAMTYTLALVDEGLLDLTRFKTPDPWNHFYAREALGVKTWDMFDLVLGAYGGKLGQALAIGGDRDQKIKNPKKASRFKPMVSYLGPFSLKKGAVVKHQVKIPSYVGSVRLMVVAGQDGAYGFAEKAVPVRNPMMVLASLPRVLGPQESVKLPVTVFAMEKSVREVSVKITTNPYIEVLGPATKKISFSKTGDQVIMFDLKVKPMLGIGKVDVMATSGSASANTSVEVDIRNPTPAATKCIDKVLAANQSYEETYKLFGLPGTRKAVVEVSALLPVDFERRIAWLIQYPYGCVEQTTSTAFPQLYLPELSDLPKQEIDKIQVNIKMALQQLKSFQLPTGGFAYWPGAYQADDWSTNYAGHFLLEAESMGYSLPAGMKENWIKYQVNAARMWMPDKYDNINSYSYRDFIQAYRLYTLVLAKSPQMAAMNRLKEQTLLSPETRYRLAAAYARAGFREQAKLLINRVTPRNSGAKEMVEIYGSINRDKAMILETLCLLGDLTTAFTLARELATAINSEEWMSTQTTAFTLIALARYLKLNSVTKSTIQTFDFNTGNGEKTTVKLFKNFWRSELPANNGKGNINIRNTSGAPLYIRIVISGIPLEDELPPIENNLKMNVVYKDLKGKEIMVNSLKQGSDFLAEVTLTNPGILGHYKNMALSQIFPSGWEIINYRITGQANIYAQDVPVYQDFRDDRVYTFFDLPAGTSRKYIVMLNAAYLGRFYLSGPDCEAMYDNRINARKAGQWVDVVR